MGEYWVGNYLAGSCRDLVDVLFWHLLGGTVEMSVRITGVHTSILTRHYSNPSAERYRYTNLLGINTEREGVCTMSCRP